MNIYYTNMILQELNKYEGVRFISMTDTSIEVEMHGHEVYISGEICACHGGRLSISIKNVGHRRIETHTYPEGVTNGDEEMEYHIKNNMIDTINDLMDVKYMIKEYSRYRKNDNDHKIEYFQDEDTVIYRIIEDNNTIKNLLDITAGYKHQYPNPKMYKVVEIVEQLEGNGFRFETQRYEKMDNGVVKPYYEKREVIEVFLYNKGKFKLELKEEE